jgi:hypothetical protein
LALITARIDRRQAAIRSSTVRLSADAMVEMLLVGHSLDGGVRVGVVESGERLVSSDG